MAADCLCRRIRLYKFRKLRFQIFKAAIQRIVLCVVDFRRVFVVIFFVVITDLLRKFRN